jgi:hypothetical protein
MKQRVLSYPLVMKGVICYNLILGVDEVKVTQSQRPVVTWPFQNAPNTKEVSVRVIFGGDMNLLEQIESSVFIIKFLIGEDIGHSQKRSPLGKVCMSHD